MTLHSIILCCVIVAFTSCNAQHQKIADYKTEQRVTPGDTVFQIGKNIRYIFQDNCNNFWFASDGEGLFKYDGKTILRMTDKDGLCGNYVRLIQQDKDSTIFVVTGNGVCIFNGKKFSTLPSSYLNINTTNLSNIILLFGNYYQNNSINKFELPLTSRLTKNYSPTPNAVYCSYKDSKGNIWFGTESNGVCKYDGKSFTWLDEEELGLAIRSIFEDKNGNIWIGNNGNGLFRYNGKTLTNFTKEHKLDNPDFKNKQKEKEGTLARVWSITEDKKGTLWIATIDAGLWKYDGKVLNNFTTKDGLASNSILTLFCDNIGNLWIGADNGVTIYDGKTFAAFGIQQ